MLPKIEQNPLSADTGKNILFRDFTFSLCLNIGWISGQAWRAREQQLDARVLNSQLQTYDPCRPIGHYCYQYTFSGSHKNRMRGWSFWPKPGLIKHWTGCVDIKHMTQQSPKSCLVHSNFLIQHRSPQMSKLDDAEWSQEKKSKLSVPFSLTDSVDSGATGALFTVRSS